MGLKEKLDKISDKHASKNKEAQAAATAYAPLAKVELDFAVNRYPTTRYTLVELQPRTGRRHQLRRHMKNLSHHILGDGLYGRAEHNRMIRDRYGCHRLMLHASRLQFEHPVTGQALDIRAGIDDSWHTLMNAFGWKLHLLTPQK